MEPPLSTHAYNSWTRDSFETIRDSVAAVARTAGAMIISALSESDLHVHLKSPVDLVTDTDRAVESYVTRTLVGMYPGSKVLAEEEASAAESKGEVLDDEPTWIIDPIDGLRERMLSPPSDAYQAPPISYTVVVGVVYNPQLNELFTATLKGGAYLNGAPIRVSAADQLNKAVVATNIGVDRTPEGAEFLTRNLRTLLLNNVQSTRSGGSSAWEMSSVACGRLDAFYERGIHSWDIAAASLLVTEAGGVVAALDGSPFDLLNRQVLCGNQHMVSILSSLLFST